MASIDFYYDVVSPYSFIGFELVHRVAQEHKASLTVNLKPFLLGAQVPAKGKYMGGDLALLFEFYGLGPYNFPNRFPANSLKPQRALLVIQQCYPGKLAQVSRKFFTFYWQEKKDFESEEEVKGVLTACGFTEAESAKILGNMNDQAVKDKLRANTEEALAKGAFGAPTMIAKRRTGEERLFFGQDRIQPMLFWLGLIPRARY